MPSPKKKPAKKRTAKKKTAKKTGRPLAVVDPNIVNALASVGCSGDEIAVYLGVSRTTIYDRFRTVIEKGHTGQRVSLRRKQFELAMKGDRTMLVWLGKQYLGQTDKVEEKQTGKLTFDFNALTGRPDVIIDPVEVKLLEDEERSVIPPPMNGNGRNGNGHSNGNGNGNPTND
jgi:hypothetical protein